MPAFADIACTSWSWWQWWQGFVCYNVPQPVL